MDPVYAAVYRALARHAIPLLGLWILFRCGTDLLRGREKYGRHVVTLALSTVYQGINGVGFWLSGQKVALLVYWAVAMTQWMMLLAYVLAAKKAFSLEILLFFLCSVGLGAVTAVKPEESLKQAAAVGMGVAAYLLVLWLLAHGRWAKKLGYCAALIGLLLLLLTQIFGKEYYGAKSWLMIGPISVQPSEICKVLFVYTGAMLLCMEKRGVRLLVVYALTVCGFMIWMNDLGAAAIFFAAFLTMVLLHRGAWTAVFLASAGAGVAAWRMPMHALRRFNIWRHIWERPLAEGFQQTRGLMCIASGGVFGLGIGAGRMGRIFAADSDLVFATICETWGLLMGAIPVIALVVLVLYAMKMVQVAGEAQVIAGCGAATILGVQGMLNVLGTVDLLPMTGVTLPFVSNGGTAMVAAWALAAFIKAMGEKSDETNS